MPDEQALELEIRTVLRIRRLLTVRAVRSTTDQNFTAIMGVLVEIRGIMVLMISLPFSPFVPNTSAFLPFLPWLDPMTRITGPSCPLPLRFHPATTFDLV